MQTLTGSPNQTPPLSANPPLFESTYPFLNQSIFFQGPPSPIIANESTYCTLGKAFPKRLFIDNKNWQQQFFFLQIVFN